MPDYFRTFYMCAGLSLSGMLFIAPVVQAQSSAATDVKHYVVVAGSLEDALNSFARQAGITLTFPPLLVEGKSSQGLQGDYGIEEGLTAILGQHALTLINNGGKFYTLTAVTASTQQSELIMLGPVKVSASEIQDAKDATYTEASSVSVLTQKDVERFRGTSVGDIFQGIAGVLVGENRNSGGLDVNIRGMQGQGRVPVLVDGARQETTVYRGYAGVAGRSYIDPDLIGNVRIDKGPVMTAEGTGATGGVVSVRTIGANDIIKDDKDWGMRLRGSLIGNNTGDPVEQGTVGGFVLGYGFGDDRIYRTRCARPDICQQMHSSGQRTYELPDTFTPTDGQPRPDLLEPKSYAGSLSVAKRFAWGDVVAAYAQRKQGNYYAGKNGNAPYLTVEEVRRTPLYTEVRPIQNGTNSRFRAEELIINSNFYSESALLKASLLLSDDKIWELSYMRYESEYGELMPSQLMWFGNITQTAQSTVSVNTYTSRYQWNSAEYTWLDLRFNLWHTHTVSENNSYSEDNQGQGFVPESEPEIYRRWGGDVSNTQHFDDWWHLELSYGLAVQLESAEPKNKATDRNIATSSSYLRDAERDEWSVFLAGTFKPLPTVTVEAGIRYTDFNSEDHNANQASLQSDSPYCVDENDNGHCDPIYTMYSGSGTAPLVSVTWEPLQGLQFYGRYAEALRMPSLFESSGGFSQMPSLELDLKPEHAKNREAGVNYLRQNTLLKEDKLGIKLAYFRNHTRDYLTRTTFNTWEDSRSSGFIAIRNIDSASFHGVELSIDYDLNWLYTSLSGTRYNKIEVCHYGSYRRDACNDYGIAGSYINNMIPPDWHGSATLGMRLFSQTLDFGFRYTLMGTRSNPEYDNDTYRGMNSIVDWQDYRLLDFYISYTPNDTVSVDFNIDNLTDRYYLDALSLGLVPSPGRTAKLSLTLNF